MDAGSILARERIVPVVVIEDPQTALPLARTLMDVGLRAIEVTLRTEHALAAIERIAQQVPGMLVGAGSVRRAEQLRQVVEAGAHFAVSPGATGALLDAAATAGLPVVPGAVTASEVMRLLDAGYKLQKFFPAESAGGVTTLKALGGPLPEARFFPTGGISAELASSYLALANVACVGGSWIAPPALLAKGDYATIEKLASAAVASTA